MFRFKLNLRKYYIKFKLCMLLFKNIEDYLLITKTSEQKTQSVYFSCMYIQLFINLNYSKILKIQIGM